MSVGDGDEGNPDRKLLGLEICCCTIHLQSRDATNLVQRSKVMLTPFSFWCGSGLHEGGTIDSAPNDSFSRLPWTPKI